MSRVVAVGMAVVLALFAIVLFGIVTSGQPLPGADLSWFVPFAQAAGVFGGAICLASALLLLGLAFGHWRHPVPDPEGHERT